MRDHIKILAILQIIYGALGALAALIVGAVFAFSGAIVGVAAQEDPDAFIAVPVLGIVGTILFLLILVCSLPGIIAGAGLLKFRPWARILTIVLSALNLFSVPLGTALGAYGLWVMLNRDTELMFQTGRPVTPTYPEPR